MFQIIIKNLIQVSYVKEFEENMVKACVEGRPIWGGKVDWVILLNWKFLS